MLDDIEIMRREHAIYKRALEEIANGNLSSPMPTWAEQSMIVTAGLALIADHESVKLLGYKLPPVE
jgi:hypothetical protein